MKKQSAHSVSTRKGYFWPLWAALTASLLEKREAMAFGVGRLQGIMGGEMKLIAEAALVLFIIVVCSSTYNIKDSCSNAWF
jgi:hypothetical protein